MGIMIDMLALTSFIQFEGILPKGPYLPCVSMAGRALLAGYPRIIHVICRFMQKVSHCCRWINLHIWLSKRPEQGHQRGCWWYGALVKNHQCQWSLRSHDMEALTALLARCARNPPVTNKWFRSTKGQSCRAVMFSLVLPLKAVEQRT